MLVIVEYKPIDAILYEYLSTITTKSMEKIGSLIEKSKIQAIRETMHYINMFIVDNLSSEALDRIVSKHVDKDLIIVPDGSSSC